MGRMIDLGVSEKDKYPDVPLSSDSTKKSNKIIYPTVYLDNIDNLPFDEEDVGKKLNILGVVEVKQVSKQKDTQKQTKSVRLEIHSIGVQGNANRSKIAEALK